MPKLCDLVISTGELEIFEVTHRQLSDSMDDHGIAGRLSGKPFQTGHQGNSVRNHLRLSRLLQRQWSHAIPDFEPLRYRCRLRESGVASSICASCKICVSTDKRSRFYADKTQISADRHVCSLCMNLGMHCNFKRIVAPTQITKSCICSKRSW